MKHAVHNRPIDFVMEFTMLEKLADESEKDTNPVWKGLEKFKDLEK